MAQAVEAARRAALADRDLTEAFALWGVAAAESEAFAAAIEPLQVAAQRAVPGSAGWAVINAQLGRALCQCARWREGSERLAMAEQCAPPDPTLRNRIGVALVNVGMAERGLPHLEWAAAANPTAADLQYDLGWALASVGRLDEAERRFSETLSLRPSAASAHLALARLRRWTVHSNHVDRLRAVLAEPELTRVERARLGFALFKELDDLGRHNEAWPTLCDANALARQEAAPWSQADDEALVTALIRTFPPRMFTRRVPVRAGAATPIFIVGLPRTGTTLVERILAAHSQVRALGELPFFPLLFSRAAGEPDTSFAARTVLKARGVDWRALGAAYLARTAFLARGAAFTTDKLPVNSVLIGPLRLALPGARIILLRREPMDALFGAYRMWLADGHSYGWSYRLEDLAAHWRQHERLMNHWRACLGDQLLEVSYEDLVTDPGAQIPRLLAGCGLPFERACLSPHEAAGIVLTISSAQVRSPITAAGVGHWRRYAAPLAQLRDLLPEIAD